MIQLYDLDFRNILDPRRKIKIYKYDERQEDAEVLLCNAAEDEDEISYDMDFRFKLHSMIHQQQIFENCAYAHFEFYPQMWFFAGKELNIFELKIYAEFKTHKAFKKMQNFFNVSTNLFFNITFFNIADKNSRVERNPAGYWREQKRSQALILKIRQYPSPGLSDEHHFVRHQNQAFVVRSPTGNRFREARGHGD